MKRPVLQLESVVVHYGRMEALHGITLEITEGDIVCLIGANGAGKTTTLNTICGLQRPSAGKIMLHGEDITLLPTADIVRRRVAQVPEGRKLFSELTVNENLDLGAYLRRDTDGIRRDLEHCFELFPILRDRLA